jgi:hypothetical protein
MKPSPIHGIHSILSGAFEAAQRWEWVDFNPAESAKPPTVRKKKTPATPPGAVVAVIEQARNAGKPAIALYVWLAAITGVRRGELCGVQICDIDLDNGWLHVAFNYVVKGGNKVRKDTKTHQDRYPAIDPVTCGRCTPGMTRPVPCPGCPQSGPPGRAAAAQRTLARPRAAAGRAWQSVRVFLGRDRLPARHHAPGCTAALGNMLTDPRGSLTLALERPRTTGVNAGNSR